MNLSFLSSIFKKKTPVYYQPVHRDDAVMEALDVAEREGKLLAERVRAELLPYVTSGDCAVSCALRLPLSIVENGNGNTTDGSYLLAVCTGVAAGVARSFMKAQPSSQLALRGEFCQQEHVLHFSLSRELAAREVGKKSAGRAPSPRLFTKTETSRVSAFLQHMPGTLQGEHLSVAQSVMQNFAWNWQFAEEFDDKAASRLAQGLLASVGLAPLPDDVERELLPFLIWQKGKQNEWLVPPSILDALILHIFAIDRFWADFMVGKKIVWNDEARIRSCA